MKTKKQNKQNVEHETTRMREVPEPHVYYELLDKAEKFAGIQAVNLLEKVKTADSDETLLLHLGLAGLYSFIAANLHVASNGPCSQE